MGKAKDRYSTVSTISITSTSGVDSLEEELLEKEKAIQEKKASVQKGEKKKESYRKSSPGKVQEKDDQERKEKKSSDKTGGSVDDRTSQDKKGSGDKKKPTLMYESLKDPSDKKKSTMKDENSRRVRFMSRVTHIRQSQMNILHKGSAEKGKSFCGSICDWLVELLKCCFGWVGDICTIVINLLLCR
jgi:hypothetical protein